MQFWAVRSQDKAAAAPFAKLLKMEQLRTLSVRLSLLSFRTLADATPAAHSDP
jgi:hypothetical protein